MIKFAHSYFYTLKIKRSVRKKCRKTVTPQYPKNLRHFLFSMNYFFHEIIICLRMGGNPPPPFFFPKHVLDWILYNKGVNVGFDLIFSKLVFQLLLKVFDSLIFCHYLFSFYIHEAGDLKVDVPNQTPKN